MPMAMSRDKERPTSTVPSLQRPRTTRFKADRIAAALRHLYGRISAEPLPPRLVEMLNRLKPRH